MMNDRDARRFRWLDQADRGWPIDRIARLARASVPTVLRELNLARMARDAQNGRPLIHVPTLELFFPIAGLFRVSRCHCTDSNHEPGSLRTCAICHRSGIDNHPGLQRYPDSEPRPEPRPLPRKAPGAPTRKQRRRAAHDQAG